MTDEAINEAVARKLGWVQCCNPKTMENGKIVDCFGWSKGGSHFHEPYPYYCRDIKAAWEMVPTQHSFSLYRNHVNGIWTCQLSDGQHVQVSEADTAPMAICLAFLKLQPSRNKCVF